MAVEKLNGIILAPRVDLSKYRYTPAKVKATVVTMRVRIPDELKAGGSLKTNFTVQMTPQGVQVDVTA